MTLPRPALLRPALLRPALLRPALRGPALLVAATGLALTATLTAAAPVSAAPSARTAAARATAARATAAERGAALVTRADRHRVRLVARQLRALRRCESGGDYRIATGNGYYGAYQFDLSTWRATGYAGRPDQAPAPVQDAAAARLQARRGWAPWPTCSRALGLR